jgi:hypothetical protein
MNLSGMKKLLIIGGLISAFLCLAQNASAQYARIHRDGTNFVDNRGVTLSDQELIGLIGDDIYFDTVVGARKQYNVGRKLIRGGAISMGAGFLAMLGGTALMYASGGSGYYSDYYHGNYPDRYYYDGGSESGMASGALLYVSGAIALTVGGLVLEAGIPLKIIGKSRLNWVENDFNDRSRGTSLHFGAAPSGLGMTLTF